MNNSKEIFSLALGLSTPWYIDGLELLESADGPFKDLHIYIDFHKGSDFFGSDGCLYKCYYRIDKTWRHLDFFQHRCYLHCRVPRIKHSDGSIRQVSVPWSRSGSGFTLLFEGYAMLLIENEMPINKVASCIRVTAHRIWRVFDYWIDIAKSKDDLSCVTSIGIDDTSIKKGHNYVTVVADMEGRRVIDVQEGKCSAAITKFAVQLETKGGVSEQIADVCIDMSPAYISGVEDTFPNANITFDKFHIIQKLNEAMNIVRKEERRNNVLLKGHRYTFLKSVDKLSASDRTKIVDLTTLYPTLGAAYRLKEMFMDVFDIKDFERARHYLICWCASALESTLHSFIKFVDLIKRHWRGILEYFNSRITNGILESINSKIQLAKRRARGYRNIKNFINMIFFTCGKLKFDYPLIST